MAQQGKVLPMKPDFDPEGKVRTDSGKLFSDLYIHALHTSKCNSKVLKI